MALLRVCTMITREDFVLTIYFQAIIITSAHLCTSRLLVV